MGCAERAERAEPRLVVVTIRTTRAENASITRRYTITWHLQIRIASVPDMVYSRLPRRATTSPSFPRRQPCATTCNESELESPCSLCVLLDNNQPPSAPKHIRARPQLCPSSTWPRQQRDTGHTVSTRSSRYDTKNYVYSLHSSIYDINVDQNMRSNSCLRDNNILHQAGPSHRALSPLTQSAVCCLRAS